MNIEVDSGSGFCFGVENAVDIAERALESGERVYCLGSIVHNDIEVERLESKGLVTVTREEFGTLEGVKVLIRAHGEPPSTYEIAQQNNITIIEATCPIVKRLQIRISKAWEEAEGNNGQVVIFGKPGHAEVLGLMGHTNNTATVVSCEKDVEELDFSRPIYLFSQTTMKVSDYSALAALIRTRIGEDGNVGDASLLTVHNTICGQVSNREPRLKEFARNHDIIIFVSGKESSNGKMLYGVCLAENPNTFMISAPDELDPAWFLGKFSVGVCGATSTPKWLIDNVAREISALTSQH